MHSVVTSLGRGTPRRVSIVVNNIYKDRTSLVSSQFPFRINPSRLIHWQPSHNSFVLQSAFNMHSVDLNVILASLTFEEKVCTLPHGT